jgi:hypothetical protein
MVPYEHLVLIQAGDPYQIGLQLVANLTLYLFVSWELGVMLTQLF